MWMWTWTWPWSDKRGQAPQIELVCRFLFPIQTRMVVYIRILVYKVKCCDFYTRFGPHTKVSYFSSLDAVKCILLKVLLIRALRINLLFQ